ncbi:MAG: HEAT repeat domain-containing protein [Cyanobacteria bacterium P01_F01_bin.150]
MFHSNDSLILKLRSPALNLRIEALNELAKMPSEYAIKLLIPLLESEDFALRKLAVMGLGNHLTPQSQHLLQQALMVETDANVLSEAANSLFDFGESAFPALVQLYHTSDHWLVKKTVVALFTDGPYEDWLAQVQES